MFEKFYKFEKQYGPYKPVGVVKSKALCKVNFLTYIINRTLIEVGPSYKENEALDHSHYKYHIFFAFLKQKCFELYINNRPLSFFNEIY